MEVNVQIVVLWIMTTCSLIHECHLTRLHGVINYKNRNCINLRKCLSHVKYFKSNSTTNWCTIRFPTFRKPWRHIPRDLATAICLQLSRVLSLYKIRKYLSFLRGQYPETGWSAWHNSQPDCIRPLVQPFCITAFLSISSLYHFLFPAQPRQWYIKRQIGSENT
jgi:hypothetical protein